MRFGSLFTGIGGLDLGLERAGMTCAWQVEIDPYARRVLEKHWPDVPCLDDVRRAHGYRQCPHRQPDSMPHCCRYCLGHGADLICGGFPCQDISVAGKGAGLAGARSGLWREYARIVDEVRPAWVLIENVPALRTRGLATVLGDLHALGYDAEWDGISASALGAPHRRDRLFVVAYSQRESLRLQQRRSGGANGPGAVVFGRDGLAGAVADAVRTPRGPEARPAVAGVGSTPLRLRPEEPRRRGSNVADADGQRRARAGYVKDETGRAEPSDGSPRSRVGDADGARLALGSEQPPREELSPAERAGLQDDPWAVEPDVGRVAHGVPSRVDRLRCLGNAVVPQVAEYVGRLIMEAAL